MLLSTSSSLQDKLEVVKLTHGDAWPSLQLSRAKWPNRFRAIQKCPVSKRVKRNAKLVDAGSDQASSLQICTRRENMEATSTRQQANPHDDQVRSGAGGYLSQECVVVDYVLARILERSGISQSSGSYNLVIASQLCRGKLESLTRLSNGGFDNLTVASESLARIRKQVPISAYSGQHHSQISTQSL
mmetsp:Transcript_41891/g.96093  ORF Transcript_41891/g.96093 Transcript_41891/m.96093 type:complete len:187 (-) Transcript_41891:693-1253(-)